MPKAKGGAVDFQADCFVPGEAVDTVSLAAFLQRFIDDSATIKTSCHARHRDRLAFTVGASSTLEREAVEDLMQDSKDWEKEEQNRRYDYLESDTWQVRKRNGSIQRHRTKSTGPLSPVSIRHDFVGSCREHRTGNEPWWPARIKVRTPGPRALVSLMVANAVTVVAEEATLGGSTSLLWREGNASAWPNVLTLPERLPPEAWLTGYGAFGVLLVYVSRRTLQHDYQDHVYYGSVVLGVLSVILDVIWGTALPSSLCRNMPVALLCGQLVSMLIARMLVSAREEKHQQAEAVMDEKS